MFRFWLWHRQRRKRACCKRLPLLVQLILHWRKTDRPQLQFLNFWVHLRQVCCKILQLMFRFWLWHRQRKKICCKRLPLLVQLILHWRKTDRPQLQFLNFWVHLRQVCCKILQLMFRFWLWHRQRKKICCKRLPLLVQLILHWRKTDRPQLQFLNVWLHPRKVYSKLLKLMFRFWRQRKKRKCCK